MLDLHCHLLPGIDDGPADFEASLELARGMAADDVRGVAATPHCRADHPGVVPAELGRRCAELERGLASAGVHLSVMPAGEVDLVWALEAGDAELRDVSYRGRGTDLLLETPYSPLPGSFEDLLFRLTVKGYRLLLAHPERNPTFQAEPDRLAELVQRGALVQVTASSLTRSPRESKTAALAHRLVLDGLAHVIASDAHGAAAPGRPGLRAGAEVAIGLVGPARTRWLVWEVPRAILKGDPLPEQPPAPEAPRRGLRARFGL